MTSCSVGIRCPGKRGIKPFTRIQLAQISQGLVPHKTLAIGCGLQAKIVDDHHLTVSGKLNIQLDSVSPQLDGTLERGQRVLRSLAAGAPVSKIQRPSSKRERS